MKTDAKIVAVISDMERDELRAVVLGASYELPTDRTRASLQSFVRGLYSLGIVTDAEILAQYNGGL